MQNHIDFFAKSKNSRSVKCSPISKQPKFEIEIKQNKQEEEAPLTYDELLLKLNKQECYTQQIVKQFETLKKQHFTQQNAMMNLKKQNKLLQNQV